MKRLLTFSGLALLLFASSAFTRQDNKYFEIAKNLEIFSNLYKELNTNYVDDLDPSQLMKTGIDAMLESLDPFTNYYSESQIEEYRIITEGRYSGIGAQILEKDGALVVAKPYAESPAVKAGLKAGDIIVKVDGKSTLGKTADDVDKIMKGVPGTDIDFTLKRPGHSKEITLTLTRGEVKIPNVPYSGLVSNDIGYINLTQFTMDAGKNVRNAFKELKKENPELKGIILDLRGNPGGLLGEAVNVCNVFIGQNEMVATIKGRLKENDRPFKTRMNAEDPDIPVTVLINKNSASASEIVSGVLQDLDRGVLLGQRSYGKGLVQNTKKVGYNSQLKLTTAKYYIPSGRCIQSVKYENGEPVDIPDEKRAKFTTRNGRTVLDGGGVKPDVFLADPTGAPVVQALQEKFLLFDFVTEYASNIDSIAAPQDYAFTDFDQFIAFLKDRGFDYKSKTEEALNAAAKQAQKDEFDESLIAEVASMQEKLSLPIEQDLKDHKTAIINLLEKEIVSRFHYQKGSVRVGLRNDLEIQQAIELLRDQEEYNRILAGK